MDSSAWPDPQVKAVEPGKRLLAVLSAKDYDAMCPLQIRPKPTALVRLGVLLTELLP